MKSLPFVSDIEWDENPDADGIVWGRLVNTRPNPAYDVGWFDHCDTCGCELTYPLEVQVDCRYPDCSECHQSEAGQRAAAGDR